MQGTRSFGLARLGAVLLVLLAMASFVRVAPAAAQDDSITIDLNELSDSGISGTATLTDNGDGTTTVSIQVDGATGGHPAHIHQGTCDELDPNPEFPLANVDEDGVSETDVDVALADLLAAPYAVNLHESATNLGVYVACGDIVAPEEDGAEEEDDTSEAETAETSVTIDLTELNDSGISGTATLTDNGDGTTTVEIDVTGAAGDHPAHIHEGTCDDLVPNPLYPLTNVDADGLSSTDVEVSLEDLLAAPYAINLHLSADNVATYVACGNITAAVGGETDTTDDDTTEDDTTGDDDGVGGETTTPSTGVGTMAGSTTDTILLAGLAAVALALLGGGLALRRREARF